MYDYNLQIFNIYKYGVLVFILNFALILPKCTPTQDTLSSNPAWLGQIALGIYSLWKEQRKVNHFTLTPCLQTWIVGVIQHDQIKLHSLGFFISCQIRGFIVLRKLEKVLVLATCPKCCELVVWHGWFLKKLSSW